VTDTPTSPTCHVTMLTHRARAGLNVYLRSLRDTLEKVTETVAATVHDEAVNAA
jgi:hypothetical protein